MITHFICRKRLLLHAKASAQKVLFYPIIMLWLIDNNKYNKSDQYYLAYAMTEQKITEGKRASMRKITIKRKIKVAKVAKGRRVNETH